MSATDEELQYVHESGMDHVTYILIMFRYVCLRPRLAHPHLGSPPARHTILLPADLKIQHGVLAICAHRLPSHAVRHVGAQCARRGVSKGHFCWRDRAHDDVHRATWRMVLARALRGADARNWKRGRRGGLTGDGRGLVRLAAHIPSGDLTAECVLHVEIFTCRTFHFFARAKTMHVVSSSISFGIFPVFHFPGIYSVVCFF